MQKELLLNDITAIAKRILPKDAKVVLFGSQARGDANDESDWDILILLNQSSVSNDDFNNFAYPLVELGWKNGEQINPIVYTVAEWNARRITPLYHNISKDGITLCH